MNAPELNIVEQQIEAANDKLRELKIARNKLAADARKAAKAAALDMSVEQYSTYSRQYLWQLRKIVQGKCCQCGGPSNGHRECNNCAARHNGYVPKRHITPEQWQHVDWSRLVIDIANDLGVTKLTVYKHRPKKLYVRSNKTVDKLRNTPILLYDQTTTRPTRQPTRPTRHTRHTRPPTRSVLQH